MTREAAGVYLDGSALEFRGEHATVEGVVAEAVAHLIDAVAAEPAEPAEVSAWGFRLDIRDHLVGGDLSVGLTKTEAALMRMLMARPGRLVRRETFLRALYGDRTDPPGPRVLDVLAWSLRAKLRRAGVPFGIETARGLGYYLSG